MVTDEMMKRAIEAYAKETGAEDWQLEGWIEPAIRAALEAALSAAEPVSSRNDEAGYVEFLNEDVPYIVRDIQGAVAILMDLETRNVIGYRVYDPDSVFAPPAPSVAVRALEWVEHQVSFPCPLWSAEMPFGVYSIEEASASDSPVYEVRLHANKMVAIKDSLSDAKAAAQADYEARIRSALSAQVQDVAGCLPEEVHEAATEVITAHECGMLRQTIWWETAAFLLAEYTMKAGDYAAAPAKQEGKP